MEREDIRKVERERRGGDIGNNLTNEREKKDGGKMEEDSRNKIVNSIRN